MRTYAQNEDNSAVNRQSRLRTVTLDFSPEGGLSDSTVADIDAQLLRFRAERKARQAEIRAIRAEAGPRRSAATVDVDVVYAGRSGGHVAPGTTSGGKQKAPESQPWAL